MKKILKIVGLVILGMIIFIALAVVFLLIKNYIDSQQPWLEKDYYTQFHKLNLQGSRYRQDYFLQIF